MHLTVSATTPLQDVADILLAGELDVGSVDQVSSAVDLVLTSTLSLLVLDLTGLTFVDGRGVARLERACRDLEAHGVEVLLVGVTPRLRRVLEVCHSSLLTFGSEQPTV